MDFFLQNDLLKIQVNEQGAELCSLWSKPENTEYLWQADATFWARRSPILFPIVGKFKNDIYTYQGRTYNMTQHGFARDSKFECISRSEQRLIFKLSSSPDTLRCYPFPFELYVTYVLLDKQVTVEFSVVNTGSEAMYFSIGAHPAFNIPLHADERLEDYSIHFDKQEQAVRHHIDRGLFSNEQTVLLNRENVLALNEELFANDALVFKHLRSEQVSIVHRSKGAVLDMVFPDFPYLGIWKKTGAPFLCIEPWCGLADTIDSDGMLIYKEGIQVLEANEEFARSYSILIHV